MLADNPVTVAVEFTCGVDQFPVPKWALQLHHHRKSPARNHLSPEGLDMFSMVWLQPSRGPQRGRRSQHLFCRISAEVAGAGQRRQFQHRVSHCHLLSKGVPTGPNWGTIKPSIKSGAIQTHRLLSRSTRFRANTRHGVTFPAIPPRQSGIMFGWRPR